MEKLTPEEYHKIIKEIIYTIGRIRYRMRWTLLPIPVPNHRKVVFEEIPKLKELLEKVL